jgi:hypothetical protein
MTFRPSPPSTPAPRPDASAGDAALAADTPKKFKHNERQDDKNIEPYSRHHLKITPLS